MGTQRRLTRLVAQIAVVEGQFATFELPKGYDYESLKLHLEGTITVTGAGTLVRAEAPCQLIQRVEVQSNGQQNHYSAPFWHSVLAHHDRAQNSNRAASLATPPTAATIAAYAVSATGVVDFCTPDGIRPKDSNLVTVGMSLFTLRLVFGRATDCFTGSPAATFSGTVYVTTSEMIEDVDQATGARTLPGLMRKVSTQEAPATATTDSHEILLPAGNLFKSITIRTELGTGEPGATVANKFRLESGVDVRAFRYAKSLARENAHAYGWMPTGYYVIDQTRNSTQAQLSEMWDLTRQAQPKLITDVTGAAGQKIQGVITEYIKLATG